MPAIKGNFSAVDGGVGSGGGITCWLGRQLLNFCLKGLGRPRWICLPWL